MPLTNDEDIEAGYTEILTAVAVHHLERPRVKVPWARVGEAGLGSADMDRMLRRIHRWERYNIDYVVYLVPADEYRPLDEMGIWGPEELDWEEFATTPEQVVRVRAATAARGLDPPG
jgi:hypothetical protein